MKKLPRNASSATDSDLSSAEKLTLMARLARGEYRIQDGKIKMLQAGCCAAVRDGLASALPIRGQVMAHQFLRKDFGITETVFESVRNQIRKKAGCDFSETLSESLTVWDCYDKADQQFNSIDAKVSPNVRSGDLP